MPVYIWDLLEGFCQCLFFCLFWGFFLIFVIVCLLYCSKTCQSLMSERCCLKSLYWPLFPILCNLSLITMAVSSEVPVGGKHHCNMMQLILLQHGLETSHTGLWNVCSNSSFSVPIHTLEDINLPFLKTVLENVQ